MSHSKEREEKNCLNCNAIVNGRYCSICGQENIVPQESALHLITHFFNDITHFDGKFFNTLKFLILKPGYLSTQYMLGRRASFLNPIKMYVFTSFVFFLVFFSVFHFDKLNTNGMIKNGSKDWVYALDSASIHNLNRNLKGYDDSTITKKQLVKYIDSAFDNKPDSIPFLIQKTIQSLDSVQYKMFLTEFGFEREIPKDSIINNVNQLKDFLPGSKYATPEEYKAALAKGIEKDSWLESIFISRQIELNQKYKGNGKLILNEVLSSFMHRFPQMLFVSLPLFALFLKWMYYRKRNYYFVSHAIFSVHYYIFIFIVLLVTIGLNKLQQLPYFSWLNWIVGLLTVFIFFYGYKAMRNFYQQSRRKTLLKFFLLLMYFIFVVMLIFVGFFIFSFLKF